MKKHKNNIENMFDDEFIEWVKEVRYFDINEDYMNIYLHPEEWKNILKEYNREKKLKELGI